MRALYVPERLAHGGCSKIKFHGFPDFNFNVAALRLFNWETTVPVMLIKNFFKTYLPLHPVNHEEERISQCDPRKILESPRRVAALDRVKGSDVVNLNQANVRP